jgi:hypothetical protein
MANGEKGHLVEHPEEAALLRKAMDDVLAGRSLNDIGREWTDAKVRERDWSGNDVGRALAMPRHAGLVVHHGEVGGTPGTWKPIVTRARWEQVCAVVKGRSRYAGLPRRRSMLTGILICGACGAPMVRSSNGDKIRLWRCHPGPRRDGCGRVSIHAARVEPIVVEATMLWVDGKDLAAMLSNEHPDMAKAQAELDALDRREEEAGKKFAAGRLSGRILDAVSRAVKAEREVVERRLASQAKHNTLSAFAGKTGALRAAWPSLSDDQRRSIISEALGGVTIKPRTKVGARFDAKRIVIGTPAKTQRSK